jgi:hypothetical protein
LTIENAKAWFLYDGSMKHLDSGTASPATVSATSAGGYLMVYGAAGSSVTVTVGS